jgi:hypothetical protein
METSEENNEKEQAEVGFDYLKEWTFASFTFFTLFGVLCGIGGFTFLFRDFIQSPVIWLLFWTGGGAVFGLFFGGITGAIRVRILQLSKRPLVFSHVSVYVISCT